MFDIKEDLEDYLIGSVKFLNCKIDLSERPLIPRPETEFWTEKALKKIKQKSQKKITCLDLFSGSGCIGVSILKNTENAHCDFGEIDKNFLEQIRINLNKNKIKKERYKIIQADIFSNIKSKYDFIFANPPYVAEERINELDIDVKKFEPHGALFAGKDGMFFIKKILNSFKNYLNPLGVIFIEIDPQQKEQINKFLSKDKNVEFSFWKDQFNKIRVVVIKNNE